MSNWIELNFGEGELFECIEILEKFHLNWKYQNGTSFTELESGQKLDGIFGRNWLDEMM